MADYWRGAISSRMLVSLLRGLPDSSALHRATNDGHTWATEHVLVWQLIYQVSRLESMLGAQGVRKQPKMPKKKKTPWAEDTSVRRFGKVNDGDQAAALAYLESLKGATSGKQ